MRSFDADVAVVGAGPAGSASAIGLARAGKQVVLLDRARFPRDKCCGDGLTAGAIRRLEKLGLRRDSVRSWTEVDTVSVRSPSGRVSDFCLPRDGVFAAVARRVDLDAALVELASASGAEVLDGHGLLGARETSDSVELEVDRLGTLSVPRVIGADGVWSPLRKAIAARHMDTYLGEWHAQRQYFGGVSREATARMWVWFERELLPGYVWSFPLPGRRANVGFGIRRGPGVSTGAMRDIWRRVLELPHLRSVIGDSAEPESPAKSWPIPTGVGHHLLSAADGRILFAGDAARAGDPMTGEGIGQATETGLLAAAATVAHSAPRESAQAYARSVYGGLFADSLVSSVLSRVLRSDAGARAALRLAGHSPWTRSRFARWLMEDYPRALLLTPSRWMRGAMSGPGAYARSAAS